MTVIATEPTQRPPRALSLVPGLTLAATTESPLASQPALSVIAVAVVACDPVSRVGLSVSLRELPGVRLLMGSADTLPTGAQVAIVAGETIDLAMCDTVRDLRAEHCVRVLICAATIDDHGLQEAVHAGASGVLRRSDASAEVLGRAVRTVARGKQLLPNLEDQAGTPESTETITVEPALEHGARQRSHPLSSREATVLTMIADGHDTREIAVQLCYSERTVKNIIHTITTRLMLRNRAHAVAYAVRHQLI